MRDELSPYRSRGRMEAVPGMFSVGPGRPAGGARTAEGETTHYALST